MPTIKRRYRRRSTKKYVHQRRIKRVRRNRFRGVNNQYGTCQETIVASDLSGNVPYAFSHVLSSYSRASAITSQFQFYRLRKVVWDLAPKFPLGLGLATAPAANNVARPMRFYYLMNRQGNQPANINLDWFLDNGCKPKIFGSSTARSLRITYRPNLTDSLSYGGPDNSAEQQISVMPVFNKWVNRYFTGVAGVQLDNDDTEYQGVFMYIDDFNNSGDFATGSCEVRITTYWDYKVPYAPVPEAVDVDTVVSKV